MAEDILGISGQMDISDIQKSFDMLLNNLNQLGVKTDEVSSKMTKALNDIASSSVSDSSKTQQSIQALKDGITEINKSLTDTPEALKKLAVEAQTAEATVDKLKKRLSETAEGSKEWTSINSQLSTQQQLVDKLNNEYSSMLGTFGNTQQYVGTLNAAIETLNAGRSISTATTGLSATAHLGAAAAVGTEAAAHGENAGKISDETVKLNENLDAQQKTIAAKEQNVSIISEEAEAIKNVTDRLQEGKVSEEEYLRVIENGSKVLENLQATRNEYVSKKAQAYENYQDAYDKGISGELTKEDATRTGHDYFTLFQEYGKKVEEVDERIRQLQESLNTLSSAYDKVQEAQQQQVHTASQAHQQEEEQSRKDVDAIKAKEEEIQRLKDEYSKLREQRPNFWGLGADIKEQKTPFSTITEWNKQTGELRFKISDAEAELEKMKNTTAEVKNATTEVKNEAAAITFGGEVATVEKVTEALKLDEQALKQLKAEYANLKGAGEGNSEAAKQNLQAQKELNKHISEGRDVLKQLGTSYEDAAKGAKKTKEETKEVAKSADEVSKKVEGFVTKLKKALGGAMKGDFSGLFSMFGKMVGWGVAIGALGKGLYELTKRAEELEEALRPLSHYIDENKLEYVRNEILALSSTTAKSVPDMASAATQFVKVWDDLRETPEALMTMVKSANEFGALSGKSSEEAAKYLSNLASEYHMTALEATDASSMIATAAHGSTSTFGEMAEALASAGTTASTYGVSFRDMATLIGYSANNFGGAQKAASKFSMLLMNMENQQNSQYKPSVVGMVQALQNMKVALDNGELSQKTFGSRVRATAKYFINNANAIAEYGKHIDSTKAKQGDLMDINARASVNVAKLQNAWGGLLTSLNANYTPILTKILNFFARIIGGAQKTAEELNYIKNFDKLHPKNKQKTIGYADEVTSGWTAGAEESVIVNLGAMQQYNMSKEEGWKNYQKQEKLLAARFRNAYKAYRKKWKNASNNAILNAAQNSTLRLFNDKRSNFSEFSAASFNEWTRKQRDIYGSLDQKTNNTGSGGNSTFKPTADKDAEKAAEKQRQYREQQAEQKAKQIAEDEKLKWELYVAEQETGITKEHDANEKELKQRKLDFEKKKHQIEEEAEQFRQKNIEAAKASYEKNPANKKKEGFYASGLDKGVTLTADQQKLINAKTEQLNAQQEAENKKRVAEELQSLYDYLKEYGTIQEQKYAITKEYAEKIAKESNLYKKATLEGERDKALKELDTKDLFNDINWDSIFSDLSGHTKKYLISLKNQLQTLVKSGKLTDVSDIEKVQQKITDINSEINKQNGIFDFIGDKQQEYIKRIEEAKNAQEALNAAKKKQQEIEEQYNPLLYGAQNLATSLHIEMGNSASELLLNTQDSEIDKTSDEYKEFAKTLQQLIILEGKLTAARKETAKATSNAEKAEDGAKKSSKQKVADWFSDAQQFITNNGIDRIPELFKSLGLDSLSDAASKGLAGFSNASKAAEEFANGNYIGAITDAISSFGNFANSALGIFTSNGNVDKMNDRIEELAKANKDLTDAISNLSESIKDNDSTNEQSVEAYKKAIQAQNDWSANQLSAIDAEASKWSSSGHGFLGTSGKHSFYHYADKNKNNWLSQFNSALDQNGYTGNLASAEDVLKLSAEQLKVLQTYATSAWTSFFNSGGEGNPKELVEEYIQQAAGAVDDLTDALNEKLTGYSWSGFKDSYTSLLSDMTSETEDFADNIDDIISKAIISSFMNSDEVQKKIKTIYQMISDATSDNNIDEDESDNIRNANRELSDYMLNWRKQMEQSGLIVDTSQSSQSATTKAIEAISEDQASSLIGIGYAMQIALEQGNEVRASIGVDISSMRGYTEQISNNITEMRDIQYEGLGQLQQIVKNTAPITLIREDISGMYKLMKDKY